MNVYTEIDASTTEVTIVLKSRDDLEKLIDWVPRLRALYPYPEPPADPVPGENIDMGITSTKRSALTKHPEPCALCDGSGRITIYDNATYPGQLCSPIGDEPCLACSSEGEPE